MIFLVAEQRNPYKGEPARPWIRIELRAMDGTSSLLELLADTGCPFAIVVSAAWLQQFNHGRALSASTNFGDMEGGWLRVAIPEVELDVKVRGYGSDRVARDVRASHSRFRGLAGLPLLRMMDYGGDAKYFWIRQSQRRA
jgi:hypothetical protein